MLDGATISVADFTFTRDQEDHLYRWHLTWTGTTTPEQVVVTMGPISPTATVANTECSVWWSGLDGVESGHEQQGVAVVSGGTPVLPLTIERCAIPEGYGGDNDDGLLLWVSDGEPRHLKNMMAFAIRNTTGSPLAPRGSHPKLYVYVPLAADTADPSVTALATDDQAATATCHVVPGDPHQPSWARSPGWTTRTDGP